MSSREDGNNKPRFFFLRLGWNLNVLPHLPGSVLKHVGFVQGKNLNPSWFTSFVVKEVSVCEQHSQVVSRM